MLFETGYTPEFDTLVVRSRDEPLVFGMDAGAMPGYPGIELHFAPNRSGALVVASIRSPFGDRSPEWRRAVDGLLGPIINVARRKWTDLDSWSDHLLDIPGYELADQKVMWVAVHDQLRLTSGRQPLAPDGSGWGSRLRGMLGDLSISFRMEGVVAHVAPTAAPTWLGGHETVSGAKRRYPISPPVAEATGLEGSIVVLGEKPISVEFTIADQELAELTTIRISSSEIDMSGFDRGTHVVSLKNDDRLWDYLIALSVRKRDVDE